MTHTNPTIFLSAIQKAFKGTLSGALLASTLLGAILALPSIAETKNTAIQDSESHSLPPIGQILELQESALDSTPSSKEDQIETSANSHDDLLSDQPTAADLLYADSEPQEVRALPSLEEIQEIQNEPRDLATPEQVRTTRRRVAYPGISISNPTGYGADKGQIYVGASYQSRTRYSGGNNPGTIFGGGVRDGAVGIGFGIGDARESVGLQVSYTAASFGGSRAPLSGGFNAKLHKQFGNGWAAAIGGEGIINIGRLPADNDQITFNDFENTYYGVVTKTFALREEYTQPFSRLIVTAGAGSGRFRSVDKIVNGEFGVGVFGTAALQVHPSTNIIAEWTGQDLGLGVSVAPFPDFPIVFTPAVRDIVGEGDGDPRFILGVGVSVKEAFRALGI